MRIIVFHLVDLRLFPLPSSGSGSGSVSGSKRKIGIDPDTDPDPDPECSAFHRAILCLPGTGRTEQLCPHRERGPETYDRRRIEHPGGKAWA